MSRHFGQSRRQNTLQGNHAAGDYRPRMLPAPLAPLTGTIHPDEVITVLGPMHPQGQLDRGPRGRAAGQRLARVHFDLPREEDDWTAVSVEEQSGTTGSGTLVGEKSVMGHDCGCLIVMFRVH
jgi:hypothetical protein